MVRRFFVIGSMLALLGVALGAFGAHALKDRVTAARLDVFETGVHYQLIHALALLATAWAVERWPGRATRLAAWSFTAGIVLFSGSLYMLVLLDQPKLGAVTPLGGLAFLVGWAALAVGAWPGKTGA